MAAQVQRAVDPRLTAPWAVWRCRGGRQPIRGVRWLRADSWRMWWAGRWWRRSDRPPRQVKIGLDIKW